MHTLLNLKDYIEGYVPATGNIERMVASKAVWGDFVNLCRLENIGLPEQLHVFTLDGKTGVAFYAEGDTTSPTYDDGYLDLFGAGFSTEFVLPVSQADYEKLLPEAALLLADLPNEGSFLGSGFSREISPDHLGFIEECTPSFSAKLKTATALFEVDSTLESYLESLSSSRRYKVRRALKEPYRFEISDSYPYEHVKFGIECCRKHWGTDKSTFDFAARQVIWAYAMRIHGYPILRTTVYSEAGEVLSVATHSLRSGGTRLVLESFTSDKSYRVGNYNLARTIQACIENRSEFSLLANVVEYDPGVTINFQPGEKYVQYKKDVCNAEDREYDLYYAIATPTGQTPEEFMASYYSEEYKVFPPYCFDGKWVV